MGGNTVGRKVLIVEDLETISIAYADQMARAGYEPAVVRTAAEALVYLESADELAAILLDLQLPDADGLVLLQDHPELVSRHAVIVVTSDGSLSRAIAAMRLGAFDYLVKPVSGDRLVASVDSASTSRATLGAKLRLHPADETFQFIGQSPQIKDIHHQIRLVADSRATILITGETGTGKEVCAEAIHRQSGRANNPFIAINCGAIPDNLLESELFGHVKGAFTGAVSNRTGAAQAADGGTLFLDEICEMPLQLQVKLLRFLQTGTIQKIGSDRPEKVDVRILCATNRNPMREVKEGRFREDLYYRLAVIPIEMPPLRERKSDIAILADRFLAQFSEEAGKHFEPLAPGHYAALEAYDWPGNIRELQNVIMRATLLNQGPGLPLSALPAAKAAARGSPPASHTAGENLQAAVKTLAGRKFSEIERIVIESAIEDAGGNVAEAAQKLGLSASTIYRKLKAW